jgi:Carbonic anhydrase
MKKNTVKIVALLFATSLLLTFSCSECKKNDTPKDVTEISNEAIIGSSILTADEQAQLTPDIVLQMLKEGNAKYTDDNLTARNNSQRISEAVKGQYPKAAVVSCLDSRVLVEDIFNQGIGDVFVARVAGNFVNEDILGSLEYSCKVSGAKVIVVLGHESCGAVKSAIDDVKLGNITAMLSKIRPAVDAAAVGFEGDKTSKNPAFVEAVCNHNIEHTISKIRANSPILKEMEDAGEIKIVGANYHLNSGKVDFFE